MSKNKAASLADLDWMGTSMNHPGEITFDPTDRVNSNNVKEEAQNQWGYDDIEPVYDSEISGAVVRNIPEADLGDVGPLIIFARDMMNRGATASNIALAMKSTFPKETINAAKKELMPLFALHGVVGRVAVDARGYRSCTDALLATIKSPYKSYIGFVIGCNCDDPHMIPTTDDSMGVVATTGNAMDDFFANDVEVYEPKMVAHCPTTRLPLFEAAVDELDEQWVSDVMIDLNSISGLPGDVSDRLKILDAKPLEKVKKAFNILEEMKASKGRKRYSEPVNASEYMLEQADNEIELCATAEKDIEVDHTNLAVHEMYAGADEAPELLDVGSIDMVAQMTEVELISAARPQQDDIQLSDAGDFELFAALEPEKPLDIDHRASDNMGDYFPKTLRDTDISMDAHLDGIFAGSDEIELDDASVAQPDIDIDMEPVFEW